MITLCPNCGSVNISVFHEIHHVPVHDAQLVRTREAALAYPRGDIILAFCRNCGFVTNVAFDVQQLDYSSDYEATPTFSGVYNRFHRQLAQRLIERYDLHDKDIIEIGCGLGEFLSLLCELGSNRGIGFDPAFTYERLDSEAGTRLLFVRDFYSDAYADQEADFICCKMTLEHIQFTADFLSTVRRAIGNRRNTIVFFQVPGDLTRIVGGMEFWHIYYEHPSYFSLGSLARLFRRCGFVVLDVYKEFGDQYLSIEARPTTCKAEMALPQEDDMAQLAEGVSTFPNRYQQQIEQWRQKLAQVMGVNARVVVWGGGAKGVSFLTTLDVGEKIRYVVDINPHKQGAFLPGSGQQIVAPEFLKTYQPDVVIAMNPIYLDEIRASLTSMALEPTLLSV